MPSGTKWYNANLGASAPEETGNLYAWGEIATKTKYTWSNYIHYVKVPAVWKTIGTDISKTEYDAAYEINKNSCMPTKTQWQELIDNCTWRKQVVHNNRYLIWEVTGPNGNSIILPINGYCYYWAVIKEYNAYYWTSTYDSSDVSKAYEFMSEENEIQVTTTARSYGVLIRPVSVN